jgi:exopolysaccharide biosynthesis polyprenyl glycosylphosphotransferase
LDSQDRGRFGRDAQEGRAKGGRRRPRAIALPMPRGAESWLARLCGPHVSPALLGLWLVEVLVSAVLIYQLLTAGDGGQPGFGDANRAAALAFTFALTSVAVGLYSAEAFLQTRQLLLNTAMGVVLALPALWLVGRVVGIDIVDLSAQDGLGAIKTVVVWTLFLFALRLSFAYALRANLFVRRVVLVGPERAAARCVAAVRTLRRGFFDVAAVLPCEPVALAPAALRARRIWGVVMTQEAVDTIPARLLLHLQERGMRLYSQAEFWERHLRRIDVESAEPHWGGSDWDPSQAGEPGRLNAVLHRALDLVLSLALLLFTLPLMLTAALAIKLDSRGPVLYRQERAGLGGKTFTLLKFRSMRTDAEARGPVWATTGDERVTRVGSFIRLIRIDELPQLVNVLKGEMSFIGPRPERPHFVAQLEQQVPFYADRALVKPGLTGWAQVNYPYGASVEDARAKLSYDLYYVKHRSLLLDVLILLATVRVVLFRHGAR